MDKRRAERVSFLSGGEISRGGVVDPIDILDISLKGILINDEDDTDPLGWQVGEDVSVVVFLNDPEPRLTFLGRVARIDATRVAVEFVRMDLDSATHLRRLIELNTGKPAYADRPVSDLEG